MTLVVSGAASAAWTWVPAMSARTAKLPISSVRQRARKVPSGADRRGSGLRPRAAGHLALDLQRPAGLFGAERAAEAQRVARASRAGRVKSDGVGGRRAGGSAERARAQDGSQDRDVAAHRGLGPRSAAYGVS